MKEKILQAIGQASLCWYPRPTGIFDSDLAIKIAEQLCHDLTKENANSGYPLLADVLAELESEAYLDNNINDWVIDFNTVKLLLSKYFS